MPPRPFDSDHSGMAWPQWSRCHHDVHSRREPRRTDGFRVLPTACDSSAPVLLVERDVFASSGHSREEDPVRHDPPVARKCVAVRHPARVF